MRHALAVTALVIAAASGGNAAEAGDAAPRAVRILFIGNSLTDSNDMPNMVAKIGAAVGVEVVTG
ncbi:MAG: hypothetical protein ACXVJT_09085, partial [Thermoanaerobaculia bacterium]